ncbi:hypothetical protein EMMF5_002516 [Cystobasidiomycetes sp. EMM_F5]
MAESGRFGEDDDETAESGNPGCRRVERDSEESGIQTLLDAEKEAAKIVQKAREYRNQRVKDARGEAAKEIDAYKTKQENEFKAFEKSHSGDNDSMQSDLDKRTEEQLSTIQSQFDGNRKVVVDKLLSRVLEVEASLHRNYKKPQTSM